MMVEPSASTTWQVSSPCQAGRPRTCTARWGGRHRPSPGPRCGYRNGSARPRSGRSLGNHVRHRWAVLAGLMASCTAKVPIPTTANTARAASASTGRRRPRQPSRPAGRAGRRAKALQHPRLKTYRRLHRRHQRGPARRPPPRACPLRPSSEGSPPGGRWRQPVACRRESQGRARRGRRPRWHTLGPDLRSLVAAYVA